MIYINECCIFQKIEIKKCLKHYYNQQQQQQEFFVKKQKIMK